MTCTDPPVSHFSQERILIVDDNLDYANNLRELLEDFDYQVTIVTDARQVLTAANESAPDLVLMDVQLGSHYYGFPNGLELFRQLRRRYSSLPVIIITGVKEKEVDFLERSLELGADDFFRKSDDPRELIARIRRRLKESVPEKRLPEQEARAKLRQILTDYFNEGELRNLCFDLHVDYESLSGAGKGDKARELVAYFEHRGRVSQLVEACQRLRPNLPW